VKYLFRNLSACITAATCLCVALNPVLALNGVCSNRIVASMIVRTPNDDPPAKLKFEATLGGRSFAIGRRVQLVLWITNQGRELITVDDPRTGGDSLRLHIHLPDGTDRSFTSGEGLAAPGVKRVPQGMRIPPHAKQNFEFDLAQLTDLSKPGAYVLKLEYSWRSGEKIWTSPELSFSMVVPRPKRSAHRR
jgi:hypothetical protein